jgi:TPR repeat protein
LGGPADIAPPDGVVTYHELDTYLHAEIPYATNGDQNPVEGDISPDGSVGEFFFLNRNRQLSLGNAPRWNPENAVAFGPPAEDVLSKAREAHRAERYDEAARMLLEAAGAGNSEAMNDLGLMYARAETGGVHNGFEKARQLWEKAAAAGNGDAMRNLGYMYDHEEYGVERDPLEARQWYEKAAAAGVSDAMYLLGESHLWEDQTENRMKGGKEARSWYEKAAVAGDSRAMYRLGHMYKEGLGVLQDYQQARQWLEKAAAAGHEDAMHDLADMYEKGLGVPRDQQKTQQWDAKANTASRPKDYIFLTHDFEPK